MLERKKKKLVGVALAAAAFASGSAQADNVNYGDLIQHYEYDWDGEDWNYVDQYSAGAGEDQVYSANTDDSALAHQSTSMGLSYDDPRNSGTAISPLIWEPSTDNHNIEIEVSSYPSGSGIRLTDPKPLQQGETDNISNSAEAALGYLIDLASAAVSLPLPDPFDFMEDEASIEEVANTSSRVEYNYNDSPPVQGIDWLSYTDSPTYEGWYRISSRSRVDAGFRVDGAPHSTEDSIGHLIGCDFQVYR